MVTPEKIRENNRGDSAAAAAFYAEDATLSLPSLTETQWARLFGGFPDATMEFTSEVVEGDTVAVPWLMVGTQTGTLEGAPEPIPPTGKQVTIRGASIYKVNAEGKLTQDTISYDRVSMMAQLGLLPEPK